jgi:alpha-tubulin suppressor-like RCC1 family protein
MKKTLILILILFKTTNYSQCFNEIKSGGAHTIALKTNGTIWSWGFGDWGQLGFGNSNNVFQSTQIGTATDWQFISTGTTCTYAIKTNGTLWKTGRFIDTGLDVLTNTFVQVGAANNWSKIAVNTSHAIGIKTDGTLWGFGFNQNGELGDGTWTNSPNPIQIGGLTNDWVKIATAGYMSFGIKTNGTMWSWGGNGSGQLGIGDLSIAFQNTPVQVGCTFNIFNPPTYEGYYYNDWRDVVSGPGSAIIMGIRNNGALYAWGGYNSGGQGGLGLGLTSGLRHCPTQVGTDTNWKLVTVGNNHCLGIKTDGTLWAWGQNDKGQLGLGTTTDMGYPTQVGTDTNWASVAAGASHTVATKTDGSVWSWGYNLDGELGDGTVVDKHSPVQISVPGCSLGNEQFGEEGNSLKIYPNPNKGIFNVKFDSLSNNLINISINDISGRKIFEKTYSNTGLFSEEIQLDAAQKGVYLVTIKDGEKQIVRKIVVE